MTQPPPGRRRLPWALRLLWGLTLGWSILGFLFVLLNRQFDLFPNDEDGRAQTGLFFQILFIELVLLLLVAPLTLIHWLRGVFER